MTKKNNTYEESLKELEQIILDIQSEKVSLDDLSKKIKKAKTLHQHCSQKLRALEEEINQIYEAQDEEV